MQRLKKTSVLFCFLLISTLSIAQTSFTKRIEGRLISKNIGVSDVHVMNTSAGRATISNESGYFAIGVTLGDTLLFSAVQFKRKSLVISAEMLRSKMLIVPLEEFVNQLDEVVVRPYDLSGDLGKDMQNMDTGHVVSATSIGLPNAHVKPPIQSVRQLQTATAGKFHPLMILNPPIDPLINAISGRTKMLKKRVARDKKDIRLQQLRSSVPDSLFLTQLKIPIERIDDFMYFCEVDNAFEALIEADSRIAIWEFLLNKSVSYRENNDLD
ncbi:hypothetical protein [Muriicola sp. Z0-33]|uniref:hypothetical protein n=1 Tax=Muriicola sp. Z0-33 TaxID=2816957 RepID=UPI0022383276|nr:hypothetical protein [Muriicola sp. Z0-33]MCW5517687.1 hypothetical protein [Muriicola sp. Z0-33]